MTARRWKSNHYQEIDGLEFRVVKGRKSSDDLRLEVRILGTWRPVRMKLGAFLADFFYENEDVLYPPPAKGGRKYLEYLRWAAERGWEKADATLRVERQTKGFQPRLDDWFEQDEDDDER